MWLVQNGYLDDVPVARVRECQARLTDFLTTRKAELLASLAREKALTDALKTELKAAAEQFKQTLDDTMKVNAGSGPKAAGDVSHA
jgi:F-type H+/Na+-transporting ATPase subunit alpha